MAAGSSISIQELLDKLNLPDDIRPDPHSDLEWMWADADCACLLNFLTSRVDSNNIVSPSDRKQYTKLSEQGVTFSCAKVERALTSLDTLEEFDEDALDVKLKEMEEESERLNQRQARLKRLTSDLNQRASQTKMDVLSSAHTLGQLQEKLSAQLHLCELDYERFQQSLTELKGAVEKLYTLYANTDISPLYCYLDLKSVYEAEQSYTSALAQFTDRRFCNGLSGVVGDCDMDSYQLVETCGLHSIQQQLPDCMLDSVSELKRLQQINYRSLQQNIDMQIERANCQAELDSLSIESSVVDPLAKMNNKELVNHLDQIKGRLASHSRELDSIKDGPLSSLLEQASALKETHMLTGDYNLKITRQQYFIDCQQQVIHKMVDQRARNELLTLMAEVEMDDIQKVRGLLSSVTTYLQQILTASKQQQQVLEEAQVLCKRYDRTVVDSRNVIINIVDRLLDEESEHRRGKILTCYKELAASAGQFVTLKRAKTFTCHPSAQAIRLLKKTSDACNNLLPRAGEDNCLLPTEITSQASELGLELKLLETNIKTIMSTISLKRKLLK